MRDSPVRVSAVKSNQGFITRNFEVTLKGQAEETMAVGAIILAIGADLYDPRGEYGHGELPNVITSQELERSFSRTVASRLSRVPAPAGEEGSTASEPRVPRTSGNASSRSVPSSPK